MAVIDGYFTQWLMITCISFIEYILKLAVSLLCNVIVPKPKIFLTLFNKAMSFTCSLILKVKDILQLVLYFLSCLIEIWKHPYL